MNIVIVEDDKVLSLLLSKMIERLGFKVMTVLSKGEDAIVQIAELKPDLVLMDIMLEDDIDGIQAMLTLREKGYQTNVVYITGNSDPVNKERALATNYIDYLIKPVGFDELKQTLSSISIN